jgi:hypothetical protein
MVKGLDVTRPLDALRAYPGGGARWVPAGRR